MERPILRIVGAFQECLSRTIFPMGQYHKEDIKQMAIDRGYEELATKPESYEICFIPDNDYRGFLKRKVEGLEEQVKGVTSSIQKGKSWELTTVTPFIPLVSVNWGFLSD